MSKPSRAVIPSRLDEIFAKHKALQAAHAKAMKVPPSIHQVAVLKRLGQVWKSQKSDAKLSRTRFKGGWTHLRFSAACRFAALQGLIRRGLAAPCCRASEGRDYVQITEAGLDYLLTSATGF